MGADVWDGSDCAWTKVEMAQKKKTKKNRFFFMTMEMVNLRALRCDVAKLSF
jgi:hypothetical protein